MAARKQKEQIDWLPRGKSVNDIPSCWTLIQFTTQIFLCIFFLGGGGMCVCSNVELQSVEVQALIVCKTM